MSYAEWFERHPPAGRTDIDPQLVRLLAGDARRVADVLGRQLTAADILDALNDTGLCLIHDDEGYAADAHRWAALVITDPLDHEPAVGTRWDQEQEDRDAAAIRRGHRVFEEDR